VFKLFFSPHGLLRRQDFWIAIGCFAIFIFGVTHVMRYLGPEQMASFWIGLIAFPALIYSFYQVCKRRLHHMGFTARPFWVFLFLLFIFWVGVAIYSGVGEYFNVMFELKDIPENKPQIEAAEKLLEESLAKATPIAKVLLTIPAVLFLAWLALAPGKVKET